VPKKAVGNTFLQSMELPLFDDASPGKLHPVQVDEAGTPKLYYEKDGGSLWLGDSLQWLANQPAGSVDLIFADPPYNIGKAEWDEIRGLDAYIEWSLRWIELASRALKKDGSLYICGFSEILADLRRPASRFFAGCKWLVWFYKNKANLSNGWGRSHEAIIHFTKDRKASLNIDDIRIPYGRHTLKYPDHPQATSSQFGGGVERKDSWRPHPEGAKPKDVFEIPVTSNGMKEKTPHPTQKPEELVRRLILASSSEGDLVLDPFSGSGTTLVCAEQLARRWSGCDLSSEYNSWAAMRLNAIPKRSVREWIEFDRDTARRRESIR